MTNLKSLKSIRFTHHKQQINLPDGTKFALKSFLLRNKLSFSDKSTLHFQGQIYYLRDKQVVVEVVMNCNIALFKRTA